MLKFNIPWALGHLRAIKPGNYLVCVGHVYGNEVMDIVFLQPDLEEFSFNPLCVNQIDYPHVLFEKVT